MINLRTGKKEPFGMEYDTIDYWELLLKEGFKVWWNALDPIDANIIISCLIGSSFGIVLGFIFWFKIIG